MAKALLVSYAGHPYSPSSLMPDNGLASLAGSLIAAGHEVKIIDYSLPDLSRQLIPERACRSLKRIVDVFSEPDVSRLRQAWHFFRLKQHHALLQRHKAGEVTRIAGELSEMVSREKPDFIGFKLWNGEGFEGARTITARIKKDHPRIRLFGGGPHAYSFGEALFKHLPLDAVCYDEGEETITELARYCQGHAKLSDIPNLLLPSRNGVVATPVNKIANLDDLPMPVYSPEVYLRIEEKMKIYIIDETRGCMFSCPFCIQSSRRDNRYRAKSPERIIHEMKRLIKDKGARHFRFGGQMTPGTLLEEIARQINDQRLDVDYTCFGHVNSMKTADFDLLKRSGLTAVFYGIESGSQTLLQKAFDKKTRVQDIEDVLIRTRRAEIRTVASLIYPAPFETPQTRQETLDLMARSRPDSVLAYFPGLYPNSTWLKNAAHYGFEITTKNYADEVVNYTIITIFPPRYWKPLPYKVNGLPFKRYAGMTEEFVRELERMGLTTFLTDEHFIIAKAAGMEPGELSKSLKKTFYSGDHQEQQRLVEQVNG